MEKDKWTVIIGFTLIIISFFAFIFPSEWACRIFAAIFILSCYSTISKSLDEINCKNKNNDDDDYSDWGI